MNSGIITDIKRFAIHDGPGIRTTVFFKGCPLDCWWCHNPENRDPNPNSRPDSRLPAAEYQRCIATDIRDSTVSISELMEELEKDRLFYDESGGGITLSGGEPLLQTDFVFELLQVCGDHDLHTAIDTCGQAAYSCFEKIQKKADLFLYDLKLMDDTQHIHYTGVSNTLILENLTRLLTEGYPVEVRIPLIPGITDHPANLEAIIQFLLEFPHPPDVALLPFNFLSASKYERLGLPNRLPGMTTQDGNRLNQLRHLFLNAGLTVQEEH